MSGSHKQNSYNKVQTGDVNDDFRLVRSRMLLCILNVFLKCSSANHVSRNHCIFDGLSGTLHEKEQGLT